MRGKMRKGLCILVGLLIALTLQVQLAHAQKKRGRRCKRALTAFDRGKGDAGKGDVGAKEH
jgi:hypothetical protein